MSDPWIIEHWPKATPFLAAYTTLFLGLFVYPRDPNIFWIWLQIPVYWMHQFEKHLCPGGIEAFVNVRVLGSSEGDWPLTPERIFWASVPLPWISFPLSAILADKYGAEFGLWMAYYSVFEGVAQVLASYAWWTVSPGLISSLLLTLPIGAVTIRTFHAAAPLSTHLHIIALEVAIMCHGAVLIWVLKFLRAEVMVGKKPKRRPSVNLVESEAKGSADQLVDV